MGVILVAATVIALYVNTIGFNNLKLMYALNTTDKTIAWMNENANGNGLYLTKVKQPIEVIKERMHREGWTYVRQEGSGYFFEKGNQEVVVTTKIWPNRNYVRISVENNVVNLAG